MIKKEQETRFLNVEWKNYLLEKLSSLLCSLRLIICEEQRRFSKRGGFLLVGLSILVWLLLLSHELGHMVWPYVLYFIKISEMKEWQFSFFF